MTVADYGSKLRKLSCPGAIGLLAANTPVTEVALQCGYDSTSAFIAMFKRSTGTTPSRYRETFARPESP